MSIYVKRREGEPANSILYRFSKMMQQAGVIKEAKKRRFHVRENSKRSNRLSALYKFSKKQEMERAKKLGL